MEGGCAPPHAIVLQEQEGDFEGLGQSVALIRLKVARSNRCFIPQARE